MHKYNILFQRILGKLFAHSGTAAMNELMFRKFL